MQDKFSIDTGVKRILINEGPEYIEFNPDVLFAEKFFSVIKEFEEMQETYQARAKELDAKTELDAYGLPVNMPEGIKLLKDMCIYLRERIDYVFGEGTSQKCFGDTLNLSVFEQFFTGLTPFIRQARSMKVQKYIPPVNGKRKRHKPKAMK